MKGEAVADKTVNEEWVRDLIARNRYLVLGTTSGDQPWVAPIEYLADEDLNLYFFSPDDARHVRHIQGNETVAIAVFDQEQPQYSADASVTLNGVQMECTAVRLSEDEYTADIHAGIEALNPPMPPYEVFRITPRRVYVPALRDGVNVRKEVEIS